MELYFMPLACSMATRIALYEAGVEADYVEIDPLTKKTLDGARSLFDANPLGLVPTLRTDEGDVITENGAILQWVAERYPDAHLGPSDARGRTELRSWLCFLGTELHRGMFTALLDKKAPEAARAYVLEKGKPALAHVERRLASSPYLLGEGFSVADAYLVTMLNWTVVTPIKLDAYPALSAYAARVRARPSVARAIGVERPLYQKEQERHAKAG